ncbi:hypothetical protein PC9H_010488 [Pleurotus ostreatus]|uniref:RNA-binding protein VTS1 n=2 Tax=Pleurotus TaxID=5320 RepID=A0A8H6ZRP8_PLEOS|nr:uncharacterized protein PC9H_010488 [Pleurotus ostreatus]KAF7422332.1 hypothetical protein PC9H_010488 [Pleurotus ostreatus]KAG9227774.1 hypothetical protein CCMSSC00406_0000580 [Pleurotus cornucopiae]KAJ8691844.1 Flap-structured DNA-binding and RNA-binding protein [Pleurotus ostreatus]
MSLRPPSTSPSPSPGPDGIGNGRTIGSRQSVGPGASLRGTPTLAPSSPRPGGAPSARPTSELLGSAGTGMFQTPEAEALDQWFENLQSYEATLEDMAAASLDINFKEELSAIEQWFKVLSEAERTAALYSLLQHSTQVQIRFFITVLQQMARSDPMTALLSPAMGGSMQSQMEAKLASIKSPGLKSNLPASPTARSFNAANRQSLVLDSPSASNFLSPDSAANSSPNVQGGHQDAAAATLAQQRAKLKASNAAHRISAPVLASTGGDARSTWGSQLGQVVEQSNSNGQDIIVGGTRPKSTEFSGTLGSPRAGEGVGDSWASMVNTPLIPMFSKDTTRTQNLDAAASKLTEWSAAKTAAPGVPRMGDPTIHRRSNKPEPKNDNNGGSNNGPGGAVYDDNGNLIQGHQGGGRGNSRNAGWNGGRSPALGGNRNLNLNNNNGDDGVNGLINGMNGLGMQMGGGVPGGFGGMGSPQMNLLAGMGAAGMNPMSPFNMNMFSAMGMSPEAQLLAAQMAANGFGQPGMGGMAGMGGMGWMGGMQPNSAGLGNKRGPPSGRSVGSNMRSPSSTGGGSTPKSDEDVDPAMLEDVPGWLRTLRLHKYTPNFEGMKWRDMVVMDEAALEAKGVAALGARRKMLKTFEIVRRKMGIEGGPPSLPPSATL